MQNELLNNLNDQQIPAVTHLDGPALVIAGPGSGKTRVLTHRVAYLIQQQSISETNILCVTFTNKAAKEIKHRVESTVGTNIKLPWAGTFHSICAKILRKDGYKIGISPAYVIYDTDDQLDVIKGIFKDFGINPKQVNQKAVLSAISSAKSELVSAEEYKQYAQGLFQKTVSKVYPQYQKRLRDNNALDFDDLLVETYNLLTKDAQSLDKYQSMFRYILVDEYQDTNHVQYSLTKLLAEGWNNLYVVGDMAQAIYSFRGADYRNILNFQKDYPKAKVYNLEQNYRSTQTILDAATNIINNNNTHIPLDLWTDNGEGEKITVYTGRDHDDEAYFVVQEIKNELSKGRDYNDIAVLYRTNAQSRNMEEKLIKSNIPYRIVGGLRFYSRKEIKDVISYLRVIHNPVDSVSWARIINVPPRGIGQKTQESIAAENWDLDLIEAKTRIPFKELISKKELLSTVELLDEIMELSGYLKWLNDGSEENKVRLENIQELRTVATVFSDLSEFLENVTLIESSNKPDLGDANVVTLMTVHASKGLEFPVVFLVGMEEGLFPHNQSMMEKSELEEERRLCYVAITRAMEQVFLTNAKSRLYFGNYQNNMPSRFLAEIPQKLILQIGAGSLGDFFDEDNSFDRGYSLPSDRFKNVSGLPKKRYKSSVTNDDWLNEEEYNRQNFSWD
ncbi:MAG: UvrD-helicase domain-containing protein [Patescibacteria group bacterium]|uniref:DNA 3'-5' helicase n=1 Tax=candidate division WWE3 bacterium TaxID=2053526 RepID=A0A955J371_UNCKA|nr:UvrD-helicase domain-containing protein [candidate division WWE3 bacterium]